MARDDVEKKHECFGLSMSATVGRDEEDRNRRRRRMAIHDGVLLRALPSKRTMAPCQEPTRRAHDA
jgi:hypothetical protein